MKKRRTNSAGRWLAGLLMALLLAAQPTLAVAGQLLACDGQCCCSAPAMPVEPVLAGQPAMGCCHPDAATPCQMSGDTASPPPMTWIHAGRLLPDSPLFGGLLSNAAFLPQPHGLQATSRVHALPAWDQSALYLQIRRLIC